MSLARGRRQPVGAALLDDGGGMAGGEDTAGEWVVVGIDGSPESRDALRWAADEAQARGAPLRVVTCWSFPAMPWGPYQPPLSGDEFAQGASNVALDEIRSVLGREPDDETLSLDVIEGAPSLRLLEYADRAQLLVVGSRGRGGFAGLLLGSVSQHLAEHADCPVVIIRPAGARRA